MIRTAVVILNWNGLSWLKRFLADVIRLSTDDETKVFVADNGSADGSFEWLAKNFPETELIRFDTNLGFAGGYNAALNQINAKYFVLLNSDVEVTENWLKPLVSFMDRNPDVASCQPKIRSLAKREFFEYAGAAGGYIDKYGYAFCRGRIFDNVEKDNGQYDDPADIFWSTGACMVVRAAAWSKCGGFDEDFFAHMEEIDLCWRFHLSGLRVAYVPGSVVYHAGGGALPYGSELKTYLNFRNSLYLLYKNLPDEKLKSILFKRRILDGIAALRFLFTGHENLRAIWKAHRDYYRAVKFLKPKRSVVKKLTITQPRHGILNKSIVFRFYILKEKIFSDLKFQ
ncbi:MAG: glycosyltransferase family 2 protein [Bacteroidales bacterium]|jgi:GT2 family glycosyltransferase|nr:glycosyltransferase family 2 protein [Bacteroidales bacterium]